MIRNVSRAALGGLFLAACPALAQGAPPETFAVHGQATFVAQGVGDFASPYVGANSLTPRQLKETADVTAFIGARPWQADRGRCSRTRHTPHGGQLTWAPVMTTTAATSRARGRR